MTWVRQRLGGRELVGLLAVSVCAFGGCFSEEAPRKSGGPGVDGPSPVLEFHRIDGLAVGDTASDAEDAGVRLVQDGEPMNSCVVMAVQSLPGISAIVVDDTVQAIELEGQNRTVAGVGPGSTKAEVTAAHRGQAVQERTNRFSFTEVAVTQMADDDPLTLIYVLDEAGERVTRVRAGRASTLLAYDEGCA